MKKVWAPKRNGFTIVELLIVIVVIAILASITLVAYNGTQARARDSRRKNDVAEIVKALQIYNVKNGNFIVAGSGCGAGGNGYGFMNGNYVGYTSISDCLMAPPAQALSQAIIDPSGSVACNGLTCHAYEKYTCAAGTYVYANLETVPHTSTDTDGTCSSTIDTSDGMNYYVKAD